MSGEQGSVASRLQGGMRGDWRVRLLALAALIGCKADTGGPGTTLSAQVTDGAGDGGTADLVSASIEIGGGEMTLQVDLTSTTFVRDSMLVVFDFDTDELATTGYSSTNPGLDGLGIDCIIDLGKFGSPTLGFQVSQWEGGGFVVKRAGQLTVTRPNGYEVTLPDDVCSDDGEALFRVEASRQLTPSTWSVRQDWAPDPSLPPASIR